MFTYEFIFRPRLFCLMSLSFFETIHAIELTLKWLVLILPDGLSLKWFFEASENFRDTILKKLFFSLFLRYFAYKTDFLDRMRYGSSGWPVNQNLFRLLSTSLDLAFLWSIFSLWWEEAISFMWKWSKK